MTPTDTDRHLAEIVARQVTPTSIFEHARGDIAFLLGLVERQGREILQLQRATSARVLAEVAAERERQEAKWGQQNHPWHVPGLAVESVRHELRIPSSTEARDYVQALADYGILSYSAILLEEVCEAVDESDDVLARHELIQVAAVAVAAVEAIDRRAVPARLADDERHLADILRRPSPPSSPVPPVSAGSASDLSSAAAGSEGGHGRVRPCPDCTPHDTRSLCLTCGGARFVGVP